MDAGRAVQASAPYPTPLAVVDEAVMDMNLRTMQARAQAAGVQLRPHAKTHKSTWIGRRQVELGAAGLTVATLREGFALAAAGITDLLLAHPPVGEPKLEGLRRLLASTTRLAVAIDDAALAAALPAGVDVFWEVDTGLHRLGTAPGEPTLAGVTRLLEVVPPGRFRGLLTHAGQVYSARDQADRRQATDDEALGLLAAARLLRERGIEVRELSVGSTPTVAGVGRHPGLTEMRPGTYVFGDANQVQLESLTLAECALCVVATVVGRPEPGRAVLDAGSKAVSSDLRVPGLDAAARVLDHPTLRLGRLSEEHAVLEGPGCPDLGSRVGLLPAHVCTTVNLHERLLVLGSAGDTRWEPVDARGWAF